MPNSPRPAGKGVSASLLFRLAKLRLENPRRTAAWYAEQLGVSPRAITKAMDQVNREWKEAYLAERQRQASEELARIDMIIEEALAGWKKSQGTKQITTRERVQKNGTVAKDKIRYTTEEPSGDPRFLKVVTDCIRLKCDVVGIEAPKKIDLAILSSGFEAIKQQLVRLVARHLPPEKLEQLLIEAEVLYTNEAKTIEAKAMKEDHT